jgi:hypothetical protein
MKRRTKAVIRNEILKWNKLKASPIKGWSLIDYELVLEYMKLSELEEELSRIIDEVIEENDL